MRLLRLLEQEEKCARKNNLYLLCTKDNNDIYIKAKDNNIEIVGVTFRTSLKSIYYVEAEKIIVIDTAKFKAQSLIKETIAEKLGHIDCNALYKLADITKDKTLVSKVEHRAITYEATTLVPSTNFYQY